MKGFRAELRGRTLATIVEPRQGLELRHTSHALRPLNLFCVCFQPLLGTSDINMTKVQPIDFIQAREMAIVKKSRLQQFFVNSEFP